MAAPETGSEAATAPPKSVLILAAPLVVSFVMRSLFTFVDTIYAATLGDAAVAAIGLTIPLEFVMIALWVGFSSGLTSNLARAMGARQGERIESLLHASRIMAMILVPLFASLGVAVWVVAPWLPLDPEVARQFQIYGTVLIVGSAFTAFWSVLPDSLVKAHEDTRSTMWAGIWSNVVNLALNTLFLFVFHWGIFGIALSTVLGRIAGLVYALSRAAHHENLRKDAGQHDVPGTGANPYRSILSLGVPAAAGYVLMAGESFVINGLLARLPDSTEALAAYSIYYRILMFAIMPAIATSVALLPFVAKRFGEKDYAGMRRAERESLYASLAYCVLLVGPTVYLAGPSIASWLAEAEATRQYTTVSLWICPLAVIAALPFFLCRPIFEGMNMARPGLVAALLRYVVLTAPMAFIGIRWAESLGYPGLYGLLLGLVAASGVASLVIQGWLWLTLRRLPA